MSNARDLAKSLGGRWHGRYGTAPCPVCQPEGRKEQNALTLADGTGGRLLAHCKKSDCPFADILAAAGVTPGNYTPSDPANVARLEAEQKIEAARRERQAHRLWQEARPIVGTVAQTYLKGRGITCPLPDSLRFHSACWHGATARRYPALIALVAGGGFAVHRTYLLPDGSWKADIKPDKAMLGPCSGGSVWLSETGGTLVVAEGIETGLSLLSGLLSGPASVWAALSTSGMMALDLPAEPGKLIVATDGEEAGREAGTRLANRAAALGWKISMLPAPDGCDWNDLLVGKI